MGESNKAPTIFLLWQIDSTFIYVLIFYFPFMKGDKQYCNTSLSIKRPTITFTYPFWANFFVLQEQIIENRVFGSINFILQTFKQRNEG